MKAYCPFCRKKIDYLSKVCPYCTTKLEGTKEWESTKKFVSILYLIAFIIAGIFILYVILGCSRKPSNDPDLQSLLNSLKETSSSYSFDSNSLEAQVIGKALSHANIPCNITEGKIYPFKTKQGFDADVNCDDNSMHIVNYSQGRSWRLYIDGEKVVSPEGW